MNEEMPQGKETVSDDEIVNAIESHDDPFVVAAEVAERFDHTRQWAHDRLQNLADEGRIQRKAAGKRSVIWWVD
ncbi:transcriptional regulator [Natronomonas marina]|uniref:transcriptional regulator n=1 Tax=Natronomonas marina TaxID=2961939 RepID=UPI0020CA11A4|nr:transcriptional regulator [Natronomonas marina]